MNKVEFKSSHNPLFDRFECWVYMNGVGAGITGHGETESEAVKMAKVKFRSLGKGRLRVRLLKYGIAKDFSYLIKGCQ